MSLAFDVLPSVTDCWFCFKGKDGFLFAWVVTFFSIGFALMVTGLGGFSLDVDVSLVGGRGLSV